DVLDVSDQAAGGGDARRREGRQPALPAGDRRPGGRLVRARLRPRRCRGDHRLAGDRQRLPAPLDQDQGRVRWLTAGARRRRHRACEASAAMGYSGRYHAASLAAVFIALAVGILIGIGLADDVVSSASEELESSLRSDLKSAEDHADDLQTQLDRSNRFSSQIVPEVLNARLAGRRVALVELGGSDDDLVASTRDAVESADGELAAVAEIAL